MAQHNAVREHGLVLRNAVTFTEKPPNIDPVQTCCIVVRIFNSRVLPRPKIRETFVSGCDMLRFYHYAFVNGHWFNGPS